MFDFVWIIAIENEAFLGTDGVSKNYIVPKNHFTGNPIDLNGSKIWIFIRGRLDRCIAVITPKKIERFIEDYHKDDYVITVDFTRSMKLTKNYASSVYFKTDLTSHYAIGLHKVTNEQTEHLEEEIIARIQKKVAIPNITSLPDKRIFPISNKPQAMAERYITKIVSSFCLEDIWITGTAKKLQPFGNFAFQLAKNENQELSSDTTMYFQRLDPVNKIFNLLSLESKEAIKVNGTLARDINLNFTEIDPSMIFAREFLFSNDSSFDVEQALKKTELAEKTHQDMLRDVVTFLKTKGIVPYQSDSIDLMFEFLHKTNIIEIKSAHGSNLISQCAKGAFQIALYLEAMKVNYGHVEAALILHTIENKGLLLKGCDALARLGIKCLIYDPSLNWPDRLSGLLP